MKRLARYVGLLMFTIVPLASGQLQFGDNLHLNGGGLLTAGYTGDYGDQISSDHGLNFGFDGNASGYYYSPNFISFNVIPYYNQSRADSSYQSLTGGSGVSATANLFTGGHFPGSVSYRDDYNSTGTFGLAGQPNFTTHGHGQGFGIGWSALLPDLPSLSASYSQGSGSGTVYGTDEETGSNSKLFNLRSTYTMEGFRLNAYYDHTNFDSTFPAFLSGGTESVENTSGHDEGIGATHSLPINGTFYANFSRSTETSDYFGEDQNTTHFTTDSENSGATFHPTQKLSLFVNQNYTDNLSGFFSQSLIDSGAIAPLINLGSGSNSLTFGGGATYQVTHFLSTQAQATHYEQSYFGKTYTGTFASGTVNYSRRIFDMFSFSAGVVDSANGQGSNAVGLVGTVNYFHRIKHWETSGSFSYAQNVQSYLITYTNSYYNYDARLHRRFGRALQWTAGFSGTHSGLTDQPGTVDRSTSYFTSAGTSRFTLNGNFTQSSGNSVLGSYGLVLVPPTPGVPTSQLVVFNGSSYGGGISATPVRRLTLSANYSRSLSNTLAVTSSRNNTEIINAQLQYRLRRIGLLAGYTSLTQGISAVGGPPATVNSFFIGVSRWFDLF